MQGRGACIRCMGAVREREGGGAYMPFAQSISIFHLFMHAFVHFSLIEFVSVHTYIHTDDALTPSEVLRVQLWLKRSTRSDLERAHAGAS